MDLVWFLVRMSDLEPERADGHLATNYTHPCTVSRQHGRGLCGRRETCAFVSVWIALFLLGCYHGVNPGMGWLFAVALGLQERKAAAVFRALVPIAAGHVLSVAIVVGIALWAAVLFPHVIVHRVAAAVLLGFGAYRLLRLRHPRWVGMRVGFWGLMLWGFVMSSAHGAGLMLLPFVTANSGGMADMPMGQGRATPALGVLMLGMHTLGYFVAMALVAFVVYAYFGVSFLRSAWLNVDLLWAIALFITGIVALLT